LLRNDTQCKIVKERERVHTSPPLSAHPAAVCEEDIENTSFKMTYCVVIIPAGIGKV